MVQNSAGMISGDSESLNPAAAAGATEFETPERLAALVDVDAVQGMLESLWQTGKIPVGLIGAPGEVLVNAGWQELCQRFYWAHAESRRRCHEVHSRLGECQESAPGRGFELACPNGLQIAGFSVAVSGRRLATLVLGPFLLHPPDEVLVRRQALALGCAVADYRQAVARVPILSPEGLDRLKGLYGGFARLLQSMAAEKLRQLQLQRQQAAAEKTFQHLYKHTPAMLHSIDRQGRLINVSNHWLESLGYERHEVIGRLSVEFMTPESRRQAEEQYLPEFFQTGVQRNVPYQLVKKCGEIVEVLLSATAERNAQGEIVRSLAVVVDVTEQKRAARRLRASEEKFKAVFRMSAAGMTIFNPQGRFLEVNPFLCRFLGHSSEELLQKTVSDITHPDSLELTRQVYHQVETGQRPYLEYEKQYLRSDGQAVWGLTTATAVRDDKGTLLGYVALVQDITALKRTAETNHRALAEAEAARDRIDVILKSVADGLLVTDLQGRVVVMNRAAEILLETTLAEIVSRPVAEFERCPELIEQIHLVLDGGSHGERTEWTLEGADARHLTLQALTTPACSLRGQAMGTITLLRDVTREREVDRMKDEFISTAAHELRTPLTSVLGYTEILLNPEAYAITDEAQKREFLSLVHAKAEALKEIIDDLLDLSRIQSGQGLALKPERLDIVALIATVLTPYRELPYRHRFVMALPEEPVVLQGDGRKIGQVLDNLLSNAVKFSPSGGQIEIGGEVRGDQFELRIRDEGIGMTPVQVEKIFDKFYRVDASNTASGGLGLGMSIARDIVLAHGGTIDVKSRPGCGTTVSLSLPLGGSSAAQGSPVAAGGAW